MHKEEDGFTLFEVVLAIGIFTMIAVLVGSILFAMQRSWAKINTNSSYLVSDRSIDRVVDMAFRNAIPFKWRQLGRQQRQIFDGQTDALTLAYLHRITNPSQGGIRFLRLFLENGKLVAQYRNSPILYWNNDASKQTVKEVLAHKVVKLSFLYANKINNAIVWSDSWDREYQYLPLAIQMTLDFANGDRVAWLRRTAGSSFETSLGKRLKGR